MLLALVPIRRSPVPTSPALRGGSETNTPPAPRSRRERAGWGHGRRGGWTDLLLLRPLLHLALGQGLGQVVLVRLVADVECTAMSDHAGPHLALRLQNLGLAGGAAHRLLAVRLLARPGAIPHRRELCLRLVLHGCPLHPARRWFRNSGASANRRDHYWGMGRRVRPLQAVLSLLGLQHATLAAPVLCRSCGAYIGDTADVVDRAYDKAIGDVSTTDFAAGDGDARRLQRFRNPEGQEFSVVPLHSYQGVTAVGPASTEASFFPPYAWSMASCARCKAHVGWEFSDPHAARRNAPQAPASSAIPGAPLPATAPVDAALDGLRGVCLDFAKGFWSYRWCYRGEIRQFHKEVDGTTTLAWSLGTYAPSAQGRQSNALHTHRFPGASEALPFHPHFHEGGQVRARPGRHATPSLSRHRCLAPSQRCDEHGKARGTEVQLFCCASERTGVQVRTRTTACPLQRHPVVEATLGGPSLRRPDRPPRGRRGSRSGRWWSRARAATSCASACPACASTRPMSRTA